jgi:hypothetical protein
VSLGVQKFQCFKKKIKGITKLWVTRGQRARRQNVGRVRVKEIRVDGLGHDHDPGGGLRSLLGFNVSRKSIF